MTRQEVSDYHAYNRGRAKSRGSHEMHARLGADNCLRTIVRIEGDRWPVLLAHWPFAVALTRAPTW